MRSLLALKALFIALVLTPLVLLATACAASAPEQLEIPVTLEGGRLSPETIQVGQGDMVTLKIEAHEPGTFHLHGYDIEQEVEAGRVTDLYFVADATGRFRITFHSAGASHESHQNQHGNIIQSEALEPGDTFTFQVTEDLEGQTIRYHSHLHPEVSGSVQVSQDAPAADTVEVEIKDMAARPADISVRLGTTIVWTNNDTVTQTVYSGQHDSMSGGGEHTEEHSESEAGEEMDIGFLEVRPQ